MADRSVDYTDTIQTWFETYNLTAQDVGDIALLDTSAGDLVDAVNEVHGELDLLDTRVGPLSNIHADVRDGTSVTQSLDNFYDAYLAWADPATAFDTTSQTATGALNELHTDYDGLNTWVGSRSFTFTGGIISASTVNEAIDDVWTDYYNFLGRGTVFSTSATAVVGAINEVHDELDVLDTRVGPLATLNNDIEGSNVVSSINLLDVKFENFTGFGTALDTASSTLAGAINETHAEHDALDTRVGPLTTIAAAVRGADVVASVDNVYDEFNSRVGSLSALDADFTGSNDNSTVAAINYTWTTLTNLESLTGALASIPVDIRGADVTNSIANLDQKLLDRDGDLGTLGTSYKTDLVGAVNELHAEINTNTANIATADSEIGNISGINDAIEGSSLSATFNNFYTAYVNWTGVGTSLTTSATTLAGAINEIESNHNSLDTRVGSLGALDAGITGANDDSIVAAINYVYGLQTGTNQEFTNATITGTLDAAGLATFSGGLTIDGGGFTSLGIDDNATANRVQIENSAITLKTATTVQGALTSTGNITGDNFYLTSSTGSINNGAGERIDFDSNSVDIVASAGTVGIFSGSAITFYKNLNLSGAGITVPSGHTITINGSEVFHPGNMGSGSGLNADLLDGVNLSSLARTDLASETFTQDVVINGDLTVLGTTTTASQETLEIESNEVVLNATVTGAPALNGLFKVNRGTSSDVDIRWNESSDVWQLTTNGSNYYRILTTNDEGAGNGLDADQLDGQHGSYYRAWANLTGVPSTFTPSAHTHAASDVTSGTFATARIPNLDASKITAGTFGTARIPNLAASKITSGTLSDSRLPSSMANKTITGTLSADLIAASTGNEIFIAAGESAAQASNVSSGSNEIVYLAGEAGVKAISSSNNWGTDAWANRHEATLVDSSGNSNFPGIVTASGLTVNGNSVWHAGNFTPTAQPASNITSGTFGTARIPNLAASKITSGTFSNARISDVAASKITAGTLNLSGSEVFANVLRLTNREASDLTVDGQLIYDTSDGLYYRASSVNYKVWSEQNDGSGSGLDADKLDGLHASSFSQTGHTHAASDITSGTLASARLPDLTVADFAGSAVQVSSEAFSNSNTVLMTAAAIEDKIESYGYTSNSGDITGVTAGSGLTGGGSSGSVTMNIGAGTGISVAADSISVNMGAFSTSNLSEGTNLYYTTTRANSAIDARVTKSFVDALNVDADTLDGIDSSAFLRSNTADTCSGLITFTAGIKLNDNDIAAFGSSSDFEIFHNGSHAYMDMNLGNLYVRDGTTTRFTFDDNGSFTATGDITAFSDVNLKENIEEIGGALDLIRGIRGVRYDWRDTERFNDRRQIGVIAQEAEETLPEVVHTNEDGEKLVNYEKMVPVLLEAIKELEARVAELEGK